MKKLKNMTRVGFEPQTSHLVAYVLHRYATEAAGMMDLSRLYKTGKHVVVSSRSVIGCRVHNVGSYCYIHGGRVRNYFH